MFDDPAVKTVGNRRGPGDSLADATILLRTIGRLHSTPLCPKGVFRFKTFEEADEWALRMMARPPAPPK